MARQKVNAQQRIFGGLAIFFHLASPSSLSMTTTRRMPATSAHLERAGTPIGPYDILIAAQARRRNLTIVTANRREFERVPGLTVQDWST
jgi:predicted nucleic acid-binding protein